MAEHEQLKFREEALKQLTTPEQLDQLIQVLNPRSWLIAATLYAIILILVLWSILGSISTRVEGPGILLAGGGDIYNAVAPAGPSHVNAILVKPGQHVTQGQVVASLSRPDLKDEIKVTQNYLADLQNKESQLKQIAASEIAARKQQTDEEKASYQRVLAASDEKLQHISAFLKLRQQAFAKGIETQENVEQTLEDFYNVKSEIEGYTSHIIQLDVDQNAFADQWNQRIRDLDLTISNEKSKIADLQSQLTLSGDVVSPIAGIVTSAQAEVGTILSTGNSVVSIASEGKGLDALAYLPPEYGKRVKAGMSALVSPSTVEKAEYGSIKGTVISVSAFPTTVEAMQATLQNPELVRQFTKEKVPIEVRIQLISDPNTVSGLKWSSSRGPNLQITPGTLVDSMVTVQEQAPITLLIPAFKKLAGI